ncbi:serine hydroxymethyltransferase [Archaeoglobus veneficus]|uniref:Serine hydroxymethyltransferase n=1 Tax=Archaeoglobus veneficus (strain DSM 11195 / SNP6) TaxID=693661 RepID=F2KP52_ARCVS|nr:serine hydroxymethyltransferase [Archaeoglobus veneficus]AEA46360.1 Glycine hydroxymethyltransferase [Archaeoglobus veneficus SNP6]
MREFEQVFSIIEEHHRLMASSLPLIASENVTSMAVRRCYTSDLGHRYAMGEIGERAYEGCEYIDEIERKAVELTKRLFNAEHANVRPISGTVANIAVYHALTSCGDSIFSLPVECGGHTSHDDTARIRCLNVHFLPFDSERFNIDIDAASRMIREVKPRLIVLGASVFLFPHPVKEIVEIAAEVGANVIYDASHVLGLIAGKQFQDPVKEGADVVTASTHKTFFGPQRAIILCKSELAEKIDYAVMPCVVSNHHLNTLAGYVIACLEMLEFGESYAKQTVRNAKRLAERLYELGMKVVGEAEGFTESHQVVIDVDDGEKAAKTLEKAGIITNRCLLPWSEGKSAGIRIGVQEVTRLGMKGGEMEYIAELISKALDGIDVRSEVVELSKQFNTVKYTFEESHAYSFI